MDCSSLLHESVFPFVDAVTVAMMVVSVVNTSGVSVGTSVWVGVAVGGMDVDVGMAGCVSAMIVDAAAIAVFLALAASIVGVVCAPQALTTIAMIINSDRI